MDTIRAFRSKRQLAYDSLLAAIVEGRIAPGSHLVIGDLARQLGISPIPIREALSQLEADGFVSTEPHVGATVTEIREGLVSEIFELLDAMETISARAACRCMDEADLDEIAHHLRLMDTLVHDPDRFSEQNMRLHEFICDRAGTHLVGRLMTQVFTHWDRLRRLYLDEVFALRTEAAQREHWDILDAFRSHNADIVESSIREHNAHARAAYGNAVGRPCPPLDEREARLGASPSEARRDMVSPPLDGAG